MGIYTLHTCIHTVHTSLNIHTIHTHLSYVYVLNDTCKDLCVYTNIHTCTCVRAHTHAYVHILMCTCKPSYTPWFLNPLPRNRAKEGINTNHFLPWLSWYSHVFKSSDIFWFFEFLIYFFFFFEEPGHWTLLLHLGIYTCAGMCVCKWPVVYLCLCVCVYIRDVWHLSDSLWEGVKTYKTAFEKKQKHSFFYTFYDYFFTWIFWRSCFEMKPFQRLYTLFFCRMLVFEMPFVFFFSFWQARIYYL